MKLALVFCCHLHRLGWAGVGAEAAAVAVFSVQRSIGPPRSKGADLSRASRAVAKTPRAESATMTAWATSTEFPQAPNAAAMEGENRDGEGE
jgi:hypothetical protein